MGLRNPARPDKNSHRTAKVGGFPCGDFTLRAQQLCLPRLIIAAGLKKSAFLF
jgi:hypothetical protein